MKRYEALETLFSNVDLTFTQKILNEPFYPVGSRGRPPRNPLGLFKAHLVRRLKHIPSDRMLVRQMWKDPRLKRICGIEADEPPFGIAVLSRFRSKVGFEGPARIVDQTVEVLVQKGRVKGEALGNPLEQPPCVSSKIWPDANAFLSLVISTSTNTLIACI